nr:RAMP superfamily CRISPR-associated protein [bacterium]
ASDPHNPDVPHSRGFRSFENLQSPVDRLFGTKFREGGLYFRDLRLPRTEQAKTVEQARVAINRQLKTAKDKHLFTTEYAEPLQLTTRIDGWHEDLVCYDDDYPPYAYCLLIAGLLAVERIGGDKSTGSGWLKKPIAITNIKYNGNDVNLEDIFLILEESREYEELR